MLCFFSGHGTQFFEFSVHFYIRIGLTIFRDKWFLLVWRRYIWSVCPSKSPYFGIYAPGDVTDFWEYQKCWYQQFFQIFITSPKINIFSRSFFCSSRRAEKKSFSQFSSRDFTDWSEHKISQYPLSLYTYEHSLAIAKPMFTNILDWL